jgi:hypothetical protein
MKKLIALTMAGVMTVGLAVSVVASNNESEAGIQFTLGDFGTGVNPDPDPGPGPSPDDPEEPIPPDPDYPGEPGPGDTNEPGPGDDGEREDNLRVDPDIIHFGIRSIPEMSTIRAENYFRTTDLFYESFAFGPGDLNQALTTHIPAAHRRLNLQLENNTDGWTLTVQHDGGDPFVPTANFGLVYDWSRSVVGNQEIDVPARLRVNTAPGLDVITGQQGQFNVQWHGVLGDHRDGIYDAGVDPSVLSPGSLSTVLTWTFGPTGP